MDNAVPRVYEEILPTASATLIDTMLDRFIGCVSTLLHWPFAVFGALFAFCYTATITAPPFPIAVVLAVLSFSCLYRLACWVMQDYQVFLGCGRGGTPSTPAGWIRVTVLKFFANVDVLEPPYKDSSLEPYEGVLTEIPIREGSRPTVRGVAPQRQLGQAAASFTFKKLVEILNDKAIKNPALMIQKSYLELHNIALKVACPTEERRVPGTNGEWDFELCHPHEIDGSLHIAMHPDDAKLVVQNGWGQMHPLATTAWYWLTYHHLIRGIRLPVPPNLVFVYAPRNEAEFGMIEQFIDAAAWFATEKEVCDKVRRGLAGRAPCGAVIPRGDALASGKFVLGPDNRLLHYEKALETGLWKWSSCGTRLVLSRGSKLA